MPNKKILVITPKLPWPATGAYEADRADGIKLFNDLGYEVKVIAKTHSWQNEDFAKAQKFLNLELIKSEYRHESLSLWRKLLKYIKIIFTSPALLDGATYEYADDKLLKQVSKIINDWRPDVLWLDSSYMWPIIKKITRSGRQGRRSGQENQEFKKLKKICRSVNFESEHFLQEKGKSLKNLIIYLAKKQSEKMTVKYSDLILAITPYDQKKYKKIGAKNAKVLPLRSLPKLIRESHPIRDRKPLKVFFAGSTYNVDHNLMALEMVIKKIAPATDKKFYGQFEFHIFGAKLPDNLKKYIKDNVVYRGYENDFESAMSEMDIALVPSLAGGGMQQKIFEPLSRGIPTISSSRGLAGYFFENGKHLLTVEANDDFLIKLEKIKDVGLRRSLSENSIKQCIKLFDKNIISDIISKSI